MLVLSALLPLAVFPQLAAAYPHRLSSVTPRDDSDSGKFRKVDPAPEINSEQYQDLTKKLPKIIELADSVSHKSWEVGTFTEALLEVYNPSLTPFEWNANALGSPDNQPEQVLKIVEEKLGGYFSGDQGNDGQQQGNDWQQGNDGQQQGNDWQQGNDGQQQGNDGQQQGNDGQQDNSNDQTGQWWDQPHEERDEPHDEVAKKRAETDEPGKKATNNFEGYFQVKSNDPKPLVDGDHSLADPASVGMATWVMANYADNRGGPSGADYAKAVSNQLKFLENGPQNGDGCISHRDWSEEFASWSDSGYMIPPFLAYLGLATKDDELLKEAITQWNLEANLLFNENHKLFKHKTNDETLWATGNGWMLMGLARVIASINSAGKGEALKTEVDQAKGKAGEVFKACFDQLVDGRIPNNMMSDDQSPESINPDSTGTAFVVAAYYRFLQVSRDVVKGDDLKSKANAAFDAVVNDIGNDYWLKNVVDPSGEEEDGRKAFHMVADPNQRVQSPEGQAGLVLMWAARTAAKE